MKTPRLLTFALMLCLASTATAQQLQIVRPFSHAPSRNEAQSYRRVDFNGNLCALLILTLNNDNVWFEGDKVQEQYKNGEWWIWLIEGANWLTVLSNDYTPLRIEFDPVRSGSTYTLGIEAPVVLTPLNVVEELHADHTMADASRFSRNDAMGRTCALLRIGLVASGAQFEGHVVHSIYRGGEWWVWIEPGTTSLTIRVDQCVPLTLHFEPMESAVTYLLTLQRGDEPVAKPVRTPSNPITPKTPSTPVTTTSTTTPTTTETSHMSQVDIAADNTRLRRKQNTSAAIKSALLPGLGQIGKGYAGSGIFTFLGEAALVGGAVGSYYMAQQQIYKMNGSTYQAASSNYNTYVYAYYGCIGGAAVLYVYNIIRAATMKPHVKKSKNGVALAPSMMPVGDGISPTMGITFSF